MRAKGRGTMLKRTLTVAAVAALGVGTFLAVSAVRDHGEAPATSEPGTVAPVSVIAPASTPTPVPARPNPAAAGVQHGDVLDFDPGPLPDGLLTYQASDGRRIVLDPDADLPETVTSDLTVTAASELERAGGDMGKVAAALESLSSRAAAGTGRGVVVVRFDADAVAANTRDSGAGWVFWAHDPVENLNHQSMPVPTAEAATAAAQAWVDEHGGASAYTVVTVTP